MMETLLKLSLVVFMVGNLLDMGLRLNLTDAVSGLRRTRFLAAILIWGFVALPALAFAIAHVLPLTPAHVTGLVLLGMAPCAPFLPPMVDRAKGDLGLAAVVMLVTAVVTVIYMPLVAPLAAPGLNASAWTIARPLVFFVLVPLAVGVAIQKAAPDVAARLHPPVKAITGIDTLAMLVLCAVVYGKGFVSLAGSYVIGAQLLFFAAAAAGPWLLGFGLEPGERVVLSLGMTTRNLGAAFAPLFSVHPGIEQAVVTVALGVLMQAAFSFVAATIFARDASASERSATA